MKSEPALIGTSLNPALQDPSTLRLNWDEPPETVLVMKKQFDNSIVPHFKHLLHFLVAEKKLTVFVEESVVEVRTF